MTAAQMTAHKAVETFRENSKGQVVLVLQGGGALGAYQGGVYQALAEAHIHPDWVAGISIGAINAAIIAGNPPELRLARLREFWSLVTSGWSPGALSSLDHLRSALGDASIGWAMATGVPGSSACA